MTEEHRTLPAAEALLEAWIDPINWEDGSAEVEAKLIEGRLNLLDDTRAFLALPAADVGDEGQVRELSDLLAQRYEQYGQEAARAERYKTALETVRARAGRKIDAGEYSVQDAAWLAQNLYAVADSALRDALNARSAPATPIVGNDRIGWDAKNNRLPGGDGGIYGDGRDINENAPEIPDWARPYIRTLKAQVTDLREVLDYLTKVCPCKSDDQGHFVPNLDCPIHGPPYRMGIESVTCIRCVEHRAVPLINTNEANGGECGACIALSTLGIDANALNARSAPASDAGLREALDCDGLCAFGLLTGRVAGWVRDAIAKDKLSGIDKAAFRLWLKDYDAAHAALAHEQAKGEANDG